MLVGKYKYRAIVLTCIEAFWWLKSNIYFHSDSWVGWFKSTDVSGTRHRLNHYGTRNVIWFELSDAAVSVRFYCGFVLLLSGQIINKLIPTFCCLLAHSLSGAQWYDSCHFSMSYLVYSDPSFFTIVTVILRFFLFLCAFSVCSHRGCQPHPV
jgi:hypothetical protein